MNDVNLPHKIRLEASSKCQLKCKGCATTLKLINPVVGSGFLTLENFKKVVDNNPSVKEIEISNWGEVFLNPEIIDIIKYAHTKVNITIQNGTNLNYATDDILEALVKYQVKYISCSIDGTSQETYSQYRVGGNYDKIITHLKKLNEYKQKYNSLLPILTWQFVVFGYNEHEIPEAKKLAQELNMNCYFKIARERDNPSPIKNEQWVKEQLGWEYMSREEYFEKTKKDYRYHNCSQLWNIPQYNWDGKVLGCCINYKGEFGKNLFHDGLQQSFNSESMKYAREMIQGRQPPRDDIPCTLCKVFQRMRETNVYYSV